MVWPDLKGRRKVPERQHSASHQNFGYRGTGRKSRVTVTKFPSGGHRDATQPSGVRRRAAGAVPAGQPRREGRVAGRGRHGHTPASQERHPAAPARPPRPIGAVALRAPAALRRGARRPDRRGVGGRRLHWRPSAASLRARAPGPSGAVRRVADPPRGRQAPSPGQPRDPRAAPRAGAGAVSPARPEHDPRRHLAQARDPHPHLHRMG